MKFRPTEVSKLLGTANDAEQLKRIQALQPPVACITIIRSQDGATNGR